jgi:hypothetical protein
VAISRMQISVDFFHAACNWRPRGYNLLATGGHSGTICKQLAASRIKFLHASCKYSAKPPVFLKYAARTII